MAMTTEEAVAKIAAAYADAEEAASAIKTKLSNTKDAWETLRDNGVIGGLEMQKRFRRLAAIGPNLQAELYALHSDDTDRARELGVDDLLPQPRGSGGR